jgi:hypothetical protein
MSDNSEAQGECPTGRCATQAPVDLTSRARTERTEAAVSFGAGGALLATGVALLLVSSRKPPSVAPTAAVGKGAAAAGLVMTF